MQKTASHLEAWSKEDAQTIRRPVEELVYFRKDGWTMKENQFFEELKTSLGQAIDYAEGNHS